MGYSDKEFLTSSLFKLVSQVIFKYLSSFGFLLSLAIGMLVINLTPEEVNLQVKFHGFCSTFRTLKIPFHSGFYLITDAAWLTTGLHPNRPIVG